MSLCLFSVLPALPAKADQAAWIAKDRADAAVVVLSKQKEIRIYCKPCGDTGFKQKAVTAVTMEKQSDTDWEVSVDGEGIDLAYVYVNIKGAWVNLARLLSVEVEDVPTVFSKPAPKLSDDKFTYLQQSSAEFKKADERLNMVWSELMRSMPKEDQDNLREAQKYWIDYGRDADLQRMLVYQKYRMDVPSAVLAGDKVDEEKAYIFLFNARAGLLEQYARQFNDKGEKPTFSGTVEDGDDEVGLVSLRLDDGWTYVYLCDSTEMEEAPDWLQKEERGHMRLSGRLDALDKFSCDKGLKREKLSAAPAVSEVKKDLPAETREQVTIIGELTFTRGGGMILPAVGIAPEEYFMFGDFGDDTQVCRGNLDEGDPIEVSGTLVTPPSGLPYFDSEQPITCTRLSGTN